LDEHCVYRVVRSSARIESGVDAAVANESRQVRPWRCADVLEVPGDQDSTVGLERASDFPS